MKILTEFTLVKAKLQIITVDERPNIFFGRFFIFPIRVTEINIAVSELVALVILARAQGLDLNILTNGGKGK